MGAASAGQSSLRLRGNQEYGCDAAPALRLYVRQSRVRQRPSAPDFHTQDALPHQLEELIACSLTSRAGVGVEAKAGPVQGDASLLRKQHDVEGRHVAGRVA